MAKHRIRNEGPYDVVVRLADGKKVNVKPGASFVGEIEAVWHGKASAMYAIEPAPPERDRRQPSMFES